MIIRGLSSNDIGKLKEVHERYYKDKFPFPDFIDNYIGTFTVVDDSNRVITGGGLRVIPEAVIITDKSFSPSQREKALLMVLDVALYLVRKNRFSQLHAFVEDDPNWVHVLKKHGFRDIVGTGLVHG